MAFSAAREQVVKGAASAPQSIVMSLGRRTVPATRVLYFDHTATLSGGEIALSNLVRNLDPTKVKAIVVLGAPGPLASRLRPKADVYILPLSQRVAMQKKDLLGVATLFRVADMMHVAAYIVRLIRFMRQHRIEVIHTNSLKADIIGGIAGRLSGRTVVWHVRDRIEDDYLPRNVVRVFRFLARTIPHYVIANSAATLRTLQLHPKMRATFIPSGIELNKTAVVHDGTSPVLPREKQGDHSTFRAGLIGRISPWKGQDVFIRAAALVKQRFSNARFVIIGAALFGEEQYEKEVRQLASELGVQDIVQFAGFSHDVNQSIAGLDMVVHASTKGEPFGQVIIEGMAASKPVVATNGGGVPEIVEDGKTGILVPMGDSQAMADAICEILADPERASTMGVRGRERVAQHFSLGQTARRVEAVYEELFSQRAQA